jgi:acetoin utilization deacetylase AcuC-like enzyme
VLDALRARGIPVVVLMAGGYGREIERTVDIHVQTLRLAQAAWSTWAARAARAAGEEGAGGAHARREGVSAAQVVAATIAASSLAAPR